jgi:hypothetical protein
MLTQVSLLVPWYGWHRRQVCSGDSGAVSGVQQAAIGVVVVRVAQPELAHETLHLAGQLSVSKRLQRVESCGRSGVVEPHGEDERVGHAGTRGSQRAQGGQDGDQVGLARARTLLVILVLALALPAVEEVEAHGE